MPNYLKRGLWLHGVARRLNDEVLTTLLETYADRMIRKVESSPVRIMGLEQK